MWSGSSALAKRAPAVPAVGRRICSIPELRFLDGSGAVGLIQIGGPHTDFLRRHLVSIPAAARDHQPAGRRAHIKSVDGHCNSENERRQQPWQDCHRTGR